MWQVFRSYPFANVKMHDKKSVNICSIFIIVRSASRYLSKFGLYLVLFHLKWLVSSFVMLLATAILHNFGSLQCTTIFYVSLNTTSCNLPILKSSHGWLHVAALYILALPISCYNKTKYSWRPLHRTYMRRRFLPKKSSRVPSLSRTLMYCPANDFLRLRTINVVVIKKRNALVSSSAIGSGIYSLNPPGFACNWHFSQLPC